MADQVYSKEKHFVEAFDIKEPVRASCKSVRPVQERKLSYHQVKPATVESPSYQSVKQVHSSECTLQETRLPEQQSLSVSQTDAVISNDLVFEDIKSKRVKDNLTLRELFSEEEGY